MTDAQIIAEIKLHMAKAFFASAYADQWEESDDSTLNPSGRDWCDMAPDEIDPAAIHAADTLEMDFLRENEMFATLADFLRYVQNSFRTGGDRPRTAEMLGHYMAMQAMGTGVGLRDAFGKDAEDFKVPYVEFGGYSLEKDYFPSND